MYQLIKPLLFRLPAETAHRFTLANWETLLAIPGIAQMARATYRYESDHLRTRCFGIEFPNPIGLAAGFDKNGEHIHAMSALGFGFIEVGTVTPRPQAGNPQPRLFRLPADRALINRMGFNNGGLDKLVQALTAYREKPAPEAPIIGGNIGKNKDTPNADAVSDYRKCFAGLFPLVDYFVVNVSSPNTPNLRDLQDKEPLTGLLSTLQHDNQGKSTPKPILLKIAPDLTDGQLDDIIEIAQTTRLAGLIASNTTISRAGLKTPTSTIENIGNGGLSGAPVRQRATEVVRYLRQGLPADFPIIGVGGISDAATAQEKRAAGANLVQVYTGLIYAGPDLIKNIKQGWN